MLNINFENKQRKIEITAETLNLVKEACKSVLENEKFTQDAEINVTFVSDRKIKQINNEFRGINKSTDVLSFPLSDDGTYDINPENNCSMLGDVIISVEHALAQAELFGHSAEREIAYLTVHSVLHLLGYDHVDEGEDKKLMRKREEEALKLMGLNIR